MTWLYHDGSSWVSGGDSSNAVDIATLTVNIRSLSGITAFNARTYLLGLPADNPAIDQLYFTSCACGDGRVDTGETCDDGGTVKGDGCSDTCTIETGFSCVGEPSACTAICGDSLLRGSETCDDGGTVAGDGCSDVCAEESGYSCVGEPSICSTVLPE